MVAGWKNIQFLEFCRVAITIRNHGDVTAQPLTLLFPKPRRRCSTRLIPTAR